MLHFLSIKGQLLNLTERTMASKQCYFSTYKPWCDLLWQTKKQIAWVTEVGWGEGWKLLLCWFWDCGILINLLRLTFIFKCDVADLWMLCNLKGTFLCIAFNAQIGKIKHSQICSFPKWNISGIMKCIKLSFVWN